MTQKTTEAGEKCKIGIVGGGLAGSHLAAKLCLHGHEVVVFDQFQQNSASRIAAGLYNIFTGRLAAKTWMAETLLAYLNEFFDIPEFIPLRKHLHRQTIYRPFRSIYELNDWTARFFGTEDEKFVKIDPQPSGSKQIKDPLGGIHILPCGWLDTIAFLQELNLILEHQFSFSKRDLSMDLSQLTPEKLEIKGEKFDHLVFCEGIKVNQNPFFDYLPIIPLKGQVLEVDIPGYDFKGILSKKVFFINKGFQSYLVGSTYEREFLSDQPDVMGRIELEARIKEAIHLPYLIKSHTAGIRPTVKDFRPVLGTHPLFKNLHVFNGLGAKGVIQAPFLASKFTNYLETNDETVLPKEVRASRFIKYFS